MYFQNIEKALTKDIKVEDLDVFKKVIRQMHENIEYIKEEQEENMIELLKRLDKKDIYMRLYVLFLLYCKFGSI